DAARPADLVPLVDLGVLTHDDHTDDVGFEVKRHSQDAVFKLDEFLGADVVQPRHTCDAVTDLNHGPDIHRAALALKAGDLVEQSPGNVACRFRHRFYSPRGLGRNGVKRCSLCAMRCHKIG